MVGRKPELLRANIIVLDDSREPFTDEAQGLRPGVLARGGDGFPANCQTRVSAKGLAKNARERMISSQCVNFSRCGGNPGSRVTL